MALNLIEATVEFLKQNPDKKFLAKEIAEWIFENYNDECREKQNQSRATVIPLDNDRALIQQIVAEIGARRPRIQKKYPEIKTTEGRPRKYYFTDSSDIEEIEQVENLEREEIEADVGNPVITEEKLYPMLCDFLLSEIKVNSMRIDEKRSQNNHGPKGNKWLHPDIVGIEPLNTDWDEEISKCVQEHADKRSKLWSFEVKILINRSNIRESFFQTVSNSSWANFSYLVASEIEGTDTMKEMRMLCSLHGIGLIKLDTDNPAESQILIPAYERSKIDWDTANRLVKENDDFKNYIKLVYQFHRTGEIKKHDWHVATDED